MVFLGSWGLVSKVGFRVVIRRDNWVHTYTTSHDTKSQFDDILLRSATFACCRLLENFGSYTLPRKFEREMLNSVMQLNVL